MKKIITALLFFCISNITFAQVNITQIQRQGGGAGIPEACLNETIRVVGTGFVPSGMTMNINSGPIVSAYTFIDANNIEFVIPVGTSGAGSGVVVYSTPFSSNAYPLAVSSAPSIITQPTDYTACEGAAYNFSIFAAGGTTMAYQWRKNSSLTGQTTTTITATSVLPDSGAVYTVDVINTACPSFVVVSNPAKLHVKRKPTNPPTLPNLNNCQNGIFTLNATPPNVGTGTWTCLSNCAGVTFTNTTIPNTQVSGIPVGGSAPVLRWNVVNGPCSVPSTVTLINADMPTSTSSIFGADTNICTTSGTVFLNGNYPIGTYTNVDWTLQGPATGTFDTPTSNYTNFTPTSGAGNYVIQYYIRNAACFSVSTKQITVHNPPVPDAGGNYTHCFGSPLSLSGLAPGGTSVFWSIGGGNGSFSGVSGYNPTYTPFGADSLGITFPVALNVSNLGCSAVSDTVTITIHTKPLATIPVGSDATVCLGGSASIPINFTGVPPFSGIGLYNGVTNTDLGTITGTTTSISVSPTTSSNYTLMPVGTFTDNNGCPGNWHGSSFMTVAPGVGATINIVPAMICSGDNATLSITPSGGGGPGWTVYFNTGGVNSTANVTGTYTAPINPTSTTTYTVDSIETIGCGKVKVVGVNKVIVVNTPPTVSASMLLNVSDDTLCQGENTTIEITGAQLNTAYKLVKNYNSVVLDSIVIGNTMSSASIVLPISKFSPGKKDTIRFTARRVGCGAVPSVTKAYVWASGLTSPFVSVLPAVTLCENKILEITPQPNVLYQWFEGANKIAGGISFRDTAFVGGTYAVKAKDTLSCILASNSVDVDYSSLQPGITGTSVSATETKLSTTSSADTYYWYAQTSTGIKKIQGATGNTISVYFDGNYYLGTITNSCFFMSSVGYPVSGKLGGSLLKQSFIETDSTIILPEMDFSSDARAYPNPISEANLTVDYIAGDVTKISFILYNPQGFPVIQKDIDGDGLIRVEIPTRGLPTGVYNLYINDGVKQVRKNIMIY